MADAVVIGAGPNGLVAANVLADAGWDVLVLEGQDTPGGAVRTGELTLPGFRHDLFSAFYPLAAGSPVLRSLDLDRQGLRWRRADVVFAHPLPDGRCALVAEDLDRTAASLDAFAPGDGDAWRALQARWEQLGEALMDALFTPFPPLAPGARLAAALGRDLTRFLRFGVLPVRRYAEESFRGEGGGLLLAGCALHSDLTPDLPGSTMFGWLLAGLGQQRGWPVPEGGAGELSGALARRLEAAGGRIECGTPVERVVVREGRARAVRTADGREHPARRAVLADVGAPALYRDLLAGAPLPRRLLEDLDRFQYDAATVKVDWALDGPIPWSSAEARAAGTLHVADDLDAMTRYCADLATGRVPGRPYLVMGQYASFDETRQPEGAETAWAYTHVPQRVRSDGGDEGLTGAWDERESAAFADRVEREVEALAPGFRDLIRARHVFTPRTMEAANANLVGGALNGGTAQIHQQLLFRPVAALGRPETPVAGLYLASSSAHPGGGVHGAPGANAARAALGRTSPVWRALSRAAGWGR